MDFSCQILYNGGQDMGNYFNDWRKHMKVFISWSGTESQQVAEILKKWIPCIIQNVEPYFSSSDIDKGARWSTDIAKELQDASFGILCVTKENLSSQWLNFEAGALSKSIDQSKVCPFLVNLKPSEIQDSPILQFQMTTATQDDVLKLFKSINANLGDNSLDDLILQTAFDAFWPKISEALEAITVADSMEDEAQTELKSSQIDEILELVRYQQKLLNNPSELLPPDYLISIIRDNERTMRKKSINRSASADIFEISQRIHHLLSMCSGDYEISNKEAMMNIEQARDLSERLFMIVRRSDLDGRF